MADDTIISNEDSGGGNPIDPRLKQLTEKVRLTSEERDEKDRLLKEEGTKNTELTVERDFYAGFSDLVSINPAAKDHKDEILGKVKGGYTVEDATYAVLGKAGKLGAPKEVEVQPIAGGSATITVPQGGSKSIGDMTREEKRQAIMDAEKRGDISLA